MHELWLYDKQTVATIIQFRVNIIIVILSFIHDFNPYRCNKPIAG